MSLKEVDENIKLNCVTWKKKIPFIHHCNQSYLCRQKYIIGRITYWVLAFKK